MESNICFFVARVFFQIDGTVANVLPRDMCIYSYVNIFTYIHYICIYIPCTLNKHFLSVVAVGSFQILQTGN